MSLKIPLLLLCLSVAVNLAAQPHKAGPVRVIFDSDIGPDYDDVGAITILHVLEQQGSAKILATVASNKYEGVAAILNVFNTYFHEPDIPVGVPKGEGVNLRDSQHWTDTLLAKYPHQIKQNASVPDAIRIYRRVLSSQPDHSVTIVTVGFLTNLANLLDSKADDLSPLGGEALVKKKVKLLVSMAGKYPSGDEFNIEKDARSSKRALENWPTPVIYSGFEIGEAIHTGLPLIHNRDIRNSPTKDVFRICIPMSPEDSAGRMSWDETAVLVAVKGWKPYYTLHPGRIRIAANGTDSWDDAGKGQFYLVKKAPPQEVQDLINNLMIAGSAFSQAPRIVNIVNFIRLLEPRDPQITEDVLYQTVVNQIALMRKHHLGGTFLLQYDALMDPRYQQLLKGLSRDSFEIGAWWEIPQPLVERSGMKWRGRYPWDWRANIGFSTGYTPREREKLIDTYMADFKKIFGYYPRSVASWFIDAHSLEYMYRKYHIVASANCKDQYGTDGYTLWGGYWNQAYYPSRHNAYMPAQHADQQIPVPVFRMLGSDPIRQYDNALGKSRQGVITLEPVYPHAGGDSAWVSWFFRQFVNGASMAFAYTQAGQENSFTWKAMARGLEIQFPLIEKLRDEKKIRVETLAATGKWFKEHFALTPSTAVTAMEDLPGGNKKTVWFDSRFYRTNLLWENGALRFRDIHLFDENMPSAYDTRPATSNECKFFTLPVVDGYLWSAGGVTAGLQFKTVVDGKAVPLEGGNPRVDDREKGKLSISWPLANLNGTLHIEFTDREILVYLDGSSSQKWFMELEAGKGVQLPFRKITPEALHAVFENRSYSVAALQGRFAPAAGGVFRIVPMRNQLVLRMCKFPITPKI